MGVALLEARGGGPDEPAPRLALGDRTAATAQQRMTPAAATVVLASVPSLDLETAFACPAELSANLFKGPEAAEGIGAFRERRPASWLPNVVLSLRCAYAHLRLHTSARYRTAKLGPCLKVAT